LPCHECLIRSYVALKRVNTGKYLLCCRFRRFQICPFELIYILKLLNSSKLSIKSLSLCLFFLESILQPFNFFLKILFNLSNLIPETLILFFKFTHCILKSFSNIFNLMPETLICLFKFSHCILESFFNIFNFVFETLIFLFKL
jgi:hypothetical protein